MGLGLLLCAYFLLTFMSAGAGEYCFVTYLLGAAVAIRATGKLKPYNPRFRWLIPFAVLYGLLAAYFALSVLNDLFLWGLPLVGGRLMTGIAGGGQALAEGGFSLIALLSLAELAASVGLNKRRDKGLRNMAFLAIWAVGQVTLLVIKAVAPADATVITEVMPVLSAILFLYQLVVYLLNSVFIYGCFSAICPQGEEFGKESKPSRFRFVNEINRKLDEKNERARLEYEQKKAQDEQKFSAKNNNRHHKKKK